MLGAKWLYISIAKANKDGVHHCHLLNDMFSVPSAGIVMSSEMRLSETKVLSELFLDLNQWDSTDLTVTSHLRHCKRERNWVLSFFSKVFLKLRS